MRSNKTTFNIRIRRARNVYLRTKRLIRRLTRRIARTQNEIARNEQIQRAIFRGAFAAGTTLYPRPDFE